MIQTAAARLPGSRLEAAADLLRQSLGPPLIALVCPAI